MYEKKKINWNNTLPNNIDFISTICLPVGQYEAVDRNLTRTNAIIAGWGAMSAG